MSGVDQRMMIVRFTIKTDQRNSSNKDLGRSKDA